MADTSPTPRAPGWMRIALIVSLAINLLIVGAVVGFVVSGGPDRKASPDQREVTSLYTRALAPEDRRALRRSFVRELAKDRANGNRLVQEFQKVVDILRTEPFDTQSLAEALSLQAAMGAKRQSQGQQILAAQIAAMSADERAAYADRLEAGIAELGKRQRDRKPRP